MKNNTNFWKLLSIQVITVWSLLSTQAIAEEIYLPNLKKNVTGTASGSNIGLDVNIASGSLTITEAAVAADGSALPAQTKVVSGYDGSVVQVIKTDNTGSVQVDVESSALPSGAATSAKQDTEIASLAAIDLDTTTIGTNTGTTATNTTSIDGKLNANYGAATGAVRTASQIGNASAVADFNAGNVSAQTLRTVIATDQTAIPASQSGTWNINNVSGTVSLPSGAATAARQDTGNASLAAIDLDTTTIGTNTGTTATNTTSIDGKLNANYGAATGAVRTAAQIGNASAVADFNAGNVSAQTLRTVIATDQTAIPASQSGTWAVRAQDGSGNALTSAAAGAQRPLDVSIRDSSGNLISPVSFGTSGSQSNSTVSTVITLTAPAGAMGFLLTNLDSSSANIRWAVGATASASVGTQLQPGRDTGFFPAGGDISVCAESGTQNYSVQWAIR